MKHLNDAGEDLVGVGADVEVVVRVGDVVGVGVGNAVEKTNLTDHVAIDSEDHSVNELEDHLEIVYEDHVVNVCEDHVVNVCVDHQVCV